MENTLSIFKALADKNRLRIMAALLQHDELCGCQLTELLEVSGATVSRHLALLAGAGLISSRKEGRWVFFRLSKESRHDFPTNWLEKKLLQSEDLAGDRKRLARILEEPAEVICRRQRRESFL